MFGASLVKIYLKNYILLQKMATYYYINCTLYCVYFKIKLQNFEDLICGKVIQKLVNY